MSIQRRVKAHQCLTNITNDRESRIIKVIDYYNSYPLMTFKESVVTPLKHYIMNTSAHFEYIYRKSVLEYILQKAQVHSERITDDISFFIRFYTFYLL